MISILQAGDREYIEKLGLDYIIGIDEAGRGTLAGPVVSAAIAISPTILASEIWEKAPLKYTKDSKQVTPARRMAIYEMIKNQYIIGVGTISANTIDTINILEATKLAWLEALDQCLLQLPLEAQIGVVIDGNIVPVGISYPHKAIIKGDNKYLSIALASIYAKVYRDNLMTEYNNEYPNYGLNQHKGYGTKLHIESIQKYGLSLIHRSSFCKNILTPKT
ncbi:MAG: ribonuclease HII [Candidatus Paceibacterota bacterium]